MARWRLGRHRHGRRGSGGKLAAALWRYDGRAFLQEKDGLLRFRLLSIEYCAAYFDALIYRRKPDGGLFVAVRMNREGAEGYELVFRFKRRAAAGL